jgi:metal-responsive CopG/Arc/MetJ family transcriptional regulator
MSTAKIAITIDETLVRKLDKLVKNHVFENRSRAIQEAVSEKINRIEKNRLAKECARLDLNEEKAMAEEGFSGEVSQWPEY